MSNSSITKASIAMAFAMALFVSIILLPPELQAKEVDKDDAEREYRDLKQKIESNERKLHEVKGVESSTLSEIEQTNRNLAEITSQLQIYRSGLQATTAKIAQVKADIDELTMKLDKRKEWLRRKVRAMRRYGRYSDVLLSIEDSKDMSQFLRRWHYLQALAQVEKKAIEEYKRDLDTLRDRKIELDRLYGRLKDDESRVAGAERYLAEVKQEKEAVLSQVRKQKASYERMIAELRDAQKRLSEVISKAGRTSAPYGGKGFRGRRGAMDWPVKGTVAAPFGTANDPRVNTPVFRNGIYITAEEGATAKAVFKGKVVFADWFKGYGKLVIVDHGEGYHTLYGNLAEIFLKVGDIIDSRGKVGVVGESGLFNRPSLYFEIRYKGKPLDPAQWLEK